MQDGEENTLMTIKQEAVICYTYINTYSVHKYIQCTYKKLQNKHRVSYVKIRSSLCNMRKYSQTLKKSFTNTHHFEFEMFVFYDSS